MKCNLTHDICLKFGSSLKFNSKSLLKVLKVEVDCHISNIGVEERPEVNALMKCYD